MEQTEITTPKNSHTADMIDHYWGSINYVTNLIKASEIKAGLILSFYGILLNLIYQSSGAFMESKKDDWMGMIFIGLWFIATAVSIYFCVRCFIPRIEGKYDRNILFFGDVITKFGDIKAFSKTFYQVSLDEEQLFSQMGEQIFIISKIADWKFRNVKKAIRFLAISLLMLCFIVIYYGVLANIGSVEI